MRRAAAQTRFSLHRVGGSRDGRVRRCGSQLRRRRTRRCCCGRRSRRSASARPGVGEGEESRSTARVEVEECATLREAVAAAPNAAVLLQEEVEEHLAVALLRVEVEECLAAASDDHDASPATRQGRGPPVPRRTPRLPHATIFAFTAREEAGPASIGRMFRSTESTCPALLHPVVGPRPCALSSIQPVPSCSPPSRRRSAPLCSLLHSACALLLSSIPSSAHALVPSRSPPSHRRPPPSSALLSGASRSGKRHLARRFLLPICCSHCELAPWWRQEPRPTRSARPCYSHGVEPPRARPLLLSHCQEQAPACPCYSPTDKSHPSFIFLSSVCSSRCFN
jgi:hypothetical protein